MHIEGIHNQLLRPLVGKTEDDIPKDTRVAVEDYTQYVAMVLFGCGCLIQFMIIGGLDMASDGFGVQE